jgi:hypothetical protein
MPSQAASVLPLEVSASKITSGKGFAGSIESFSNCHLVCRASYMPDSDQVFVTVSQLSDPSTATAATMV